MSRRENTVNVLLGTILVLAFFLPFLAFLFAIYLLELFTARFLPGLGLHGDTVFDAIIAGFVFVEAIDALRWSRWRNVFLSSAVVSIFIIVYGVHLRLGSSSDMLWFFLAMVYFGMIHPNCPSERILAASSFFWARSPCRDYLRLKPSYWELDFLTKSSANPPALFWLCGLQLALVDFGNKTTTPPNRVPLLPRDIETL